MKDIQFQGQDLVLHEAGLLLWPKEKLAVVADLHLEKGSHFAKSGQFLPPQDSYECLQKLREILQFCGAERVIFLGDSLHDAYGFQRMDTAVRNAFVELCAAYEIIWVLGNHDGGYVPQGVRAVENFIIDPIVFRHEAVAGAKGEVSGHYHPKAFLKLRGQKVSRPCFLIDENRMILPAFGVYTGGLDILDPALISLMENDFTAYLLGERRIYGIPSRKLKHTT